ncbi:MAG: hypothetical protein JW941_03815 [Candidatus Coatesbacteria bacterium]|nr:hypothetical protein [Candidatus Coatesbacteria bacterium]
MRWNIIPLIMIIALGLGTLSQAALTRSLPRSARLAESGAIVINVRDDLSGVNPSSIHLIVDGQEVKPSLTSIDKGYCVSYSPPTASAPSYEVEISASDMARNTMHRFYRFSREPDRAPSPLSSESGPACAHPPLRRVSDNIDQGSQDPRSCWGPRAVLDPNDSLGQAGKGLSHPVNLSRTALHDALFEVGITSRLREADGGELYSVAFDVECNRASDGDFDLLVGLIDPSGEVIFYEPEEGRRDTSLRDLEAVNDSTLRLELDFEPNQFMGNGYTWCAVVSRADTLEIVSNVASSPFTRPLLDSAGVDSEPADSP